MYLALKKAGVPAELHIYATAAHDFGVRPSDHPCSTWTQACATWLRHQGFLKPPTQGHNLDGAIDFMRIAGGTLADAKTTIDELYAWEFNGPFLYDFTGRERPAVGGEAGAIDEDAPAIRHAQVRKP